MSTILSLSARMLASSDRVEYTALPGKLNVLKCKGLLMCLCLITKNYLPPMLLPGKNPILHNLGEFGLGNIVTSYHTDPRCQLRSQKVSCLL